MLSRWSDHVGSEAVCERLNLKDVHVAPPRKALGREEVEDKNE